MVLKKRFLGRTGFTEKKRLAAFVIILFSLAPAFLLCKNQKWKQVKFIFTVFSFSLLALCDMLLPKGEKLVAQRQQRLVISF